MRINRPRVGLGGQPDAMRFKGRMYDSVDVGATALQQFTFNGNSAFDPGRSHSSGQALNFPDYSALYQKYKVHGAKINIKVFAKSTQTTNATGSYRVGLVALPEVVSLNSFDDVREQPYSKVQYAILGTRMCNMSLYMTTRKMFGTQVLDSQYEALVTADPATLWTFAVLVERLDKTAMTAGEVGCDFTITQYMTLFNRDIRP